jgi:small-conductance mechanosensitive channel
MAGAARVPFAAGVDRAMPEWLGRLHPRYRTPHLALLLQGTVSSAIFLASVFLTATGARSSIRDAYDVLVSLTILVYFIPYLYLFLAAPRLVQQAAVLRAVMIVGIVATAASIVAIMLVLRWIGGRIVAGDPLCRSWKGVIGRVFARTGIAFMVVTALDIVISDAAAPARLGRIVDIAFIVVAAFQAAIWGRELVLGVISHRVGESTETTLGNAAGVIRVLVSVAFFAIALVVILDNLGINVTALVAGLGIGGIAIGLAAQGIFSDLFAALSILFDRPFRRGDTVRYGTTTATVERIGLKTTRLRAMTGEQVIMANTKLLENEIHNLADGSSRRQTIAFSLVYQLPAGALDGLAEIARPAIDAQRGCKLVRCLPTNLGPSGIDCECIYDDKSKEPDTLARHKAAIITALLPALAERGLALAYPTRTTYTAAPDGTLVMPYAPPAKA